MLSVRQLLLTILLFFPIATYASTYGIGGVADNIMGPVTLFANFVGSGSIAIGISALFASFIKFLQYRVNPLQSPISTVIVLFVMGLVLLLLPLSYKLTSGGIPLGS